MNNLIRAITYQWNHLFLKLIVSFSAFLFFIFLFYVISSFNSSSWDELTVNLYGIKDLPIYAGILQKAGMVLWIASASICFFTVYLKRDKQNFFLFAGFISTLFALDEMFLLHSKIIPLVYLISQNFVYIIYGIVITIFLIKYRERILRSEFIILYASLFFLLLKVVIDGFQNKGMMGYNKNSYIEDSAKLLGIFLWFYYFTRFAFFKIRARNRGVFELKNIEKFKTAKDLSLKKKREAD